LYHCDKNYQVQILSVSQLMLTAFTDRIARLDSHHRVLIALTLAVATFFMLPPSFSLMVTFVLVWLVFVGATLGMMWLSILLVHPRDSPRLSQLEDSSRTLILILVVSAAVASLLAVIAMLGHSTDANQATHTTLAIVTVVGSWTLVHTIFTLRYAHLYYGSNLDPAKRLGGLDFPHEPEPDYLDFAYFSFVIGMTSQVSDVAIGSKPMRRTALIHGVLSFAFNAIIIALTISGLSSML
jgi:uncharacterized membrane protein